MSRMTDVEFKGAIALINELYNYLETYGDAGDEFDMLWNTLEDFKGSRLAEGGGRRK